jgi:hypothetical protein
MTTRRAAETLLFDVESTCQIDQLESTVQIEQLDKPEATAEFPQLDSKGALPVSGSAQTKDGREAGEEFPHVEGRWEIPKLDKLEAAGGIPQLDKLEATGEFHQLDRLEAKGQLPETGSLKGNVEIPQYPTAQTKDGRGAGSQSRKLTRFDAGKSTRVEIRGDVLPMGDKTILRMTKGTRLDTPERRRICATHCPRCRGWVEVRLQPVRLRCTRCGLEARP